MHATIPTIWVKLGMLLLNLVVWFNVAAALAR